MKKWLITGAGGFLGEKLIAYYGQKEDIQVIGTTRQTFDFTEEEQVKSVLDKWSPDVVLHTAAISDTSICEQNPEQSYLVNVTGVKNLAFYCGQQGIKLMSCSSDQVYTGAVGLEPHGEEEKLSPSNVYGRHKLEAEQIIESIGKDGVSLRLTWLYEEPSKKSNIITLLRKTVDTKTPLIVSPHDYRGLTWATELVSNMEQAAMLPGGVYNFGSENELDFYETLRHAMITYVGTSELIKKDMERYGDNPRNLAMKTDKIKSFGISFSNTLEGLQRTLLV